MAKKQRVRRTVEGEPGLWEDGKGFLSRYQVPEDVRREAPYRGRKEITIRQGTDKRRAVFEHRRLYPQFHEITQRIRNGEPYIDVADALTAYQEAHRAPLAPLKPSGKARTPAKPPASVLDVLGDASGDRRKASEAVLMEVIAAQAGITVTEARRRFRDATEFRVLSEALSDVADNAQGRALNPEPNEDGYVMVDDDGTEQPIELLNLRLAQQTRAAATDTAAMAKTAAAGLPPSITTRGTPPRSSLSVSELEKLRQNENKLSPETVRVQSVYLKRFIEVFDDIPVTDITPDVVQTFIDRASNLAKAGKRGAKFEELEAMPGERISAAQVQKHLEWLTSLCEFARVRRKIAINPAADIRGPKDGRPFSDRKQPFTARQTQMIFTEITDRWRNSGDPQKEARFWFVSLAMFTGMRSGEVAQLTTNDLFEVEGVTVVSVNDRHGKTIKNLASLRDIPIPQALLDLGFMNWLRGVPSGKVFGVLDSGFPVKPKGSYSSRVSRVFSDLLNGLDCVTDPHTGARDMRLSLHSTRHRFIAAGWAANVSGPIFRRYVGHAPEGEHEASYARTLAPSVVKAAIDVVDVFK